MYDLPTTPQTLPCDDKDPFLVFHEDDTIENDSVRVRIGCSNLADVFRDNSDKRASFFLATSRQTKEDFRNNVRKKLNFDEPSSTGTVEKRQMDNENNNRINDRSLPVHQTIKNKRRLYRSKQLSRSKLSNMIKTVLQSPAKNPASPDKSSRKIYHSLEDEDDSFVPYDYDDDRSSAHSLPARLVTSLPWKKRSSTNSSSSTTTTSASLVPRIFKLKWNRMLQIDSLSTFKSCESSHSSIQASSAAKTDRPTRAIVAVELSSSSSTVSSATSGTSSLPTRRSLDNGYTTRFMAESPRLASMLKQGLYNSRVEEEEDEDTDNDHPEAGSFAFAIGRGEY